MIAPELSVTVPRITPVAPACPNSLPVATISSTAQRTRLRFRIIMRPPEISFNRTTELIPNKNWHVRIA
jgi:hypothetical protein